MTLREIENKILLLQEEITHLWFAFRQLQRQETKIPADEMSFIGLIGEEAFQGSDVIKEGFARFMTEMGIDDCSVGIEQLQERMAKLNLAPEEISSTLIQMREES